MAILIEAGIASQNFVSFFWILGPIFWSKIWKSFFIFLMKSWTLNHPFYVAREEGCFHAQYDCWTSAVSTNVSHILGVSFFSLEIYILHTCQLQLHSTTGLIDWTCQVCVDTKHYMCYVCGQSKYMVLWCGLGLRNVFLTYGWLQ